MHEEIKKKLRSRMDKTIDSLHEEFKKIRSGRANAGLVEGLVVDYYGSRTPLKQLASISVPEPRLIVIQPWDKGALSEIEKSFHKSDLGLKVKYLFRHLLPVQFIFLLVFLGGFFTGIDKRYQKELPAFFKVCRVRFFDFTRGLYAGP